MEGIDKAKSWMRSPSEGVSTKKREHEDVRGLSPGALLHEVASDIEGKPLVRNPRGRMKKFFF